MKKRILSIALAFCLIIPCVFMLTACDNTTYINVTTIEELKSALINDIENNI